jgi:hypothetical protein
MSSAQKTLTSSRVSPSSSSLVRSGCTFKTPWASTTKYNIILPDMRRQTLRKPRSSTRHDHRSSTLTDAIQKPKKTLIPAAALLSLSLSLSLSMILTTQLQKGLSKAAPREPKRPSSIQCHEERERERASHRASEASSLCDRPTERPRRAPSASEREREEREGEKQERPCAALPVKLTRVGGRQGHPQLS